MRSFHFFAAIAMLQVLCACQDKPAAAQPVVVAASPAKSMRVDPAEQRRKAFETKIEFDRAILNHVATEKIVFDWKTVGIPKHLKGWKLFSQNYDVPRDEHASETWRWSYAKKGRGINIQVTSYKTGNQAALLAIRDFPNRSNSVEPPYSKGPADLGTISLITENGSGDSFYWADRDLEFSVEASYPDDAIKTAYWLNSIAQAHRQPR